MSKKTKQAENKKEGIKKLAAIVFDNLNDPDITLDLDRIAPPEDPEKKRQREELEAYRIKEREIREQERAAEREEIIKLREKIKDLEIIKNSGQEILNQISEVKNREIAKKSDDTILMDFDGNGMENPVIDPDPPKNEETHKPKKPKRLPEVFQEYEKLKDRQSADSSKEIIRKHFVNIDKNNALKVREEHEVFKFLSASFGNKEGDFFVNTVNDIFIGGIKYRVMNITDKSRFNYLLWFNVASSSLLSNLFRN